MTRTPKPYRSRKLGNRELAPETLMMGYGYSPHLSEGALKPPLFQTSTFVFRTAQEGKASFELAYGLREKARDEEMHLIYSRINNPNLEVLEDRLAVWDGAEKALAFASGMAAISTTLMTFLRPGDTFVFLRAGLWRHGIPDAYLVASIRHQRCGLHGGGRRGRVPRSRRSRLPRRPRNPAARSARSMSRRRPTRPTAWSISPWRAKSPKA